MKLPDTYLICILGLLLGGGILLANIYLAKFIVKKALKKFIIPDLESKGLIFINHEWLGFFQSGDFRGGDWLITSVPNSWSSKPIFVNVYYKSDDGENRVTARIAVSVLTIDGVAYSHAF